MSRTIFVPSCSVKRTAGDFQLYPGELGKRIYNEISKEAPGAVAAQADHADQREKAQHDEPGAPQTA